MTTPQSRQLYREAERCFRLAQGVAGARLCEELEAIGREFEREAEEIERAARESAESARSENWSAPFLLDLDQG